MVGRLESAASSTAPRPAGRPPGAPATANPRSAPGRRSRRRAAGATSPSTPAPTAASATSGSSGARAATDPATATVSAGSAPTAVGRSPLTTCSTNTKLYRKTRQNYASTKPGRFKPGRRPWYVGLGDPVGVGRAHRPLQVDRGDPSRRSSTSRVHVDHRDLHDPVPLGRQARRLDLDDHVPGGRRVRDPPPREPRLRRNTYANNPSTLPRASDLPAGDLQHEPLDGPCHPPGESARLDGSRRRGRRVLVPPAGCPG